MFWNWLWKVLAILLVLAIFVGGGIMLYRAGYAQGITAEAWTAEEGGDVLPRQVIPHADPYFKSYLRPRMFFPGFSLFFGFILLLVIFGGIGRLIHYKMWRSEGMPFPPHWSPGWYKYHHPHDKGEAPSRDKPSKGDESGGEAGPSA